MVYYVSRSSIKPKNYVMMCENLTDSTINWNTRLTFIINSQKSNVRCYATLVGQTLACRVHSPMSRQAKACPTEANPDA